MRTRAPARVEVDNGLGQDTTMHWHGLHPHGFAFRVLSRQGRPTPRREWLDTVLLERDETAELAFVADNPGDWLFHCHILEHMEAGMNVVFRVV